MKIAVVNIDGVVDVVRVSNNAQAFRLFKRACKANRERIERSLIGGYGEEFSRECPKWALRGIREFDEEFGHAGSNGYMFVKHGPTSWGLATGTCWDEYYGCSSTDYSITVTVKELREV